jgi:hypothetical protein
MANKNKFPKKGTATSTSLLVSKVGATPQVATKVVATDNKGSVKVSTPSLDAKNFILSGLGSQDEAYADMVLNSLNAREISSVSTVSALVSSDPIYQPIKNLAESNFNNSSDRISPNVNNQNSFFELLSINLGSRIPGVSELLQAGEIDDQGNPRVVYFDETLMSVVINLTNVIDEEVEVSFISFTSLNDDTIY